MLYSKWKKKQKTKSKEEEKIVWPTPLLSSQKPSKNLIKASCLVMRIQPFTSLYQQN